MEELLLAVLIYSDSVNPSPFKMPMARPSDKQEVKYFEGKMHKPPENDRRTISLNQAFNRSFFHVMNMESVPDDAQAKADFLELVKGESCHFQLSVMI